VAVRLAAASPGLDLPSFLQSRIGVDARVLAFSAGVTLLTVLLFGLAPSLQMSFADLQAALQQGGGRGAGGGAGRRTRGALVVVEVAVAAALAVGSGLLVRSFLRLLAEEPGFAPRGVVTANVELPPSLYGEWHDVSRFYGELIEGLATRPGVQRAAATGFLPLDPGWRIEVAVPERQVPAEQEPEMQHVTVTPGYFETLGIPLLAGRAFDRRDTARSAPAVVVSREAARRLWPETEAVGRTLTSRARRIGPLAASVFDGNDWQVVGVVGDVKNAGLGAAEPMVYFVHTQFPCRNMNLVARGAQPADVAAALRAEVKRRDPGLALDEARPLAGLLAGATARPRFLATLMSGFAALALVLAAVGIYGVLSYAVGQRRGEIGVRMALGAAPGDVRRLVLGEGLALAGLGFAAGAAASLGLARLMASLLFGVESSDGFAYGTALGAVALTALAACYLPARRAAQVAPSEALRAE
jgi:predicted permease